MDKEQLHEELEAVGITVFAMTVGWLALKLHRRAKPHYFPKKAPRTPLTAVFHDMIPGWEDMRQRCPESYIVKNETFGTGRRPCFFNMAEQWKGRVPHLQATIIHLNDAHRWTREEIADWLETLDHDLTFKTPEEVNR